jgi:hypothetical protein
MSDFADSIAAIKTTATTLIASGVDPVTVAVSLASVSMHIYKELAPNDELTEEDMKKFFMSLAGFSGCSRRKSDMD